MPLLGWPLVVTLGVVAVGAPIATVLLWGRTGRGHPNRLSSRVALVVASQLAAVLLAVTALNDYGYFYTSWAELFGHGSGGAVTASTGGQVAGRGASAPGAGTPESSGVRILADLGPQSRASWARSGRVLQVQITGAASALSSQAYVWLPPAYYAPQNARVTLPAAEVLSGYPGSSLGLVKGMDYPAHLLAEIAAHRAKPMVLVMLRPSVAYPRDTECTNVPAGPQVESFLAMDLPAAITATFRVGAGSWGIMGDSTGGYCAAKIAMDHFDRFRAGVVLSGYFNALHDHTTGDLWGGSSTLRHLNSLDWRLQHEPPPPVSLFVATSRGERGPEGYVESKRFLGLVRAPMQVTTMVLASGGHNFGSWGREMGPAFDWLSSRLGP